MYLYTPFLANTGDFLDNAAQTSTEIANQLNELWEVTLSSPLWDALNDVGLLIACATLGFFILHLIVQLDQSEFGFPAFSELIWPLILILAFANNGALMADTCIGIRNYINNVNTFVLQYTASGISLQEAFEEARNTGVGDTLIADIIDRCNNPEFTPAQTLQCLDDGEAEAEEIMNQITGGSPTSWWGRFLDRLDQARDLVTEEGGGLGSLITAQLSATWGAIATTVIKQLLYGLNAAYQWGVEIALLITALISPLAFGGTLLPRSLGIRPIIPWFSGMLALGMAKLSFNITIGLVSLLIVNAEANEPMFFAVFIGVFAPNCLLHRCRWGICHLCCPFSQCRSNDRICLGSRNGGLELSKRGSCHLCEVSPFFQINLSILIHF